MSLRGLAILGLLLVTVVLVAWKVDRRAPPAPGAAPETVGALLPAELDAVSALELVRAGETLRVERSGDRDWRIVSPIEAEADPREVQSLFRAAKDAKIRRVLEDRAADRAPFGLAPAAATLRVERKDGSGTVALEIGRESPMGGARYAAAADGRLLLVQGLDAGVTDCSAETMREHRLIPIEETEIQRISLTRPGGTLALEREGSDWRLTAPAADVADTPTTDGLARTLAALAYAKGASAPLQTPGSAEIVVSVVGRDGRTLGAELGPAKPDGTRWARRAGSATAAMLETASLSDVTRDASEYRDHRVIRLDNDEILAVRIVDGAHALRASRKDGTSKWSVQEEPGGTAIAGSESKVNELLDRLRWLRAERFDAPEPGADARVVEFQGAQGALGRIEIDREPDADRKEFRVRSSWRPGASLSVKAERLGTLPIHASDLTDAATP